MTSRSDNAVVFSNIMNQPGPFEPSYSDICLNTNISVRMTSDLKQIALASLKGEIIKKINNAEQKPQ